MPLYFFRHGEAFQVGEEGIESDAERFLTPKGMKVTRQVCQALQSLDVSADEIWSSPWVRARQTAEIVAETLNGAPIILQDGLAHLRQMDKLFRSLVAWPPQKNLFLVGHQPYLGDWIARLTSGSKVSGNVTLSKSGVALVDLLPTLDPKAPMGDLKWLLTAKQLKKIR